ncbi:MAG: carbonic anhydrase [Actinomycetota bacterium]|nr:carbonic anhydrase [Actinomycetota bacterium]
MFDDLLAANRRYGANFGLSGIPAAAARGFALVTCMDSRIEPLTMLGLGPGDAKILRNGGGRVTTDVLRSLALATHLLGVTRIAIMHHTKCALATQTDDDLRARLPAAVAERAAGWDLHAMPEPDAALIADVETVLTCPLLPASTRVEGWRYDVDTGLIRQVVRSRG